MKISTKISISFLAIIILVFFQLVITQKLQNDILESTRQIQNVEVPLQSLVQQGVIYGSISTMQIQISVLHSQKGEYSDIRDHKLTYDAVEIKLNDIFNRDAGILVNQSRRPQEAKDNITAKFKEIERLNLLMKSLGGKTFAAIDTKDIETAYSLSVGGDYENYQQQVQSVVKDLAETVGQDTLDIQNTILRESQQIIYFNLVCSLVGILFLIVVLSILRRFIFEMISKKK
jgi:hypothetical protein